MKISPDTETTGLLVHQKDVAFLVMALEDPENGDDPTERLWEIEIDETTRKWADTDANRRTIDDCDDYFQTRAADESVEWIFHNAPFDLHALEPITDAFLRNFSLEDDSVERIHDTVPMSHVHDNQGTHELKELGIIYLRERPGQRDEMVEASKAIRRYLKYIPDVKAGKGISVVKEDYWLAGIAAKKYPEVVEKVTPSLLPFLRDENGNRVYTPAIGKLFTRTKLSDEERAIRDEMIERVRAHLEVVCPVYGMQDVYLTIRMFYMLSALFDRDEDPAQRWASYRQEQRVCWTLYQMQRRGIRTKAKKLAAKIEQFEERVETQLVNMRRITGIDNFNPDSSPQMQSVFFGDGASLQFEPVKITDAGNASCDADVCKELFLDTLAELTEDDRELIGNMTTEMIEPTGPIEDPAYALRLKRALFFRCLADWKAHSSANKYLKSYNRLASDRGYPFAVAKQVDGRTRFTQGSWETRRERCLYANWNGSGTAPGRLSAKQPNTQNWSKGKKDDLDEEVVKATIRDIFGPDEGDVWFSIDYKQLQVRIFAYMAQDENLIRILQAGGDVHSEIAKAVFRTDEPTKAQRRAVKAITFGILFGSQPKTIARRSGLPDGYARFMEYFKSLSSFMDATIRQARKKGYVTRCDGYRLGVPHNRIFTTAVCYVIQGSEAALVKTAMVDLEAALIRTPMRQLYQVHDEIGFEYLNPFRHDRSDWVRSMTPRQKGDANRRLQSALVEKVSTIMENAGAQYGFVTPVDVEYTTTDLGTLKSWEAASHNTAA